MDSYSNDSDSSFDSSVTSELATPTAQQVKIQLQSSMNLIHCLCNNCQMKSRIFLIVSPQTCSELIKTSLKLSLEMKRKSGSTDLSPKIEHRPTKKAKSELESSDEEMIFKSSRRSNFIVRIQNVFSCMAKIRPNYS